MLVLGLVNAVELQPWAGWVLLQVKRRDLDRLLFVGGQARQAVGESIGNSELHLLANLLCECLLSVDGEEVGKNAN